MGRPEHFEQQEDPLEGLYPLGERAPFHQAGMRFYSEVTERIGSLPRLARRFRAKNKDVILWAKEHDYGLKVVRNHKTEVAVGTAAALTVLAGVLIYEGKYKRDMKKEVRYKRPKKAKQT